MVYSLNSSLLSQWRVTSTDETSSLDSNTEKVDSFFPNPVSLVDSIFFVILVLKEEKGRLPLSRTLLSSSLKGLPSNFSSNFSNLPLSLTPFLYFSLLFTAFNIFIIVTLKSVRHHSNIPFIFVMVDIITSHSFSSSFIFPLLPINNKCNITNEIAE